MGGVIGRQLVGYTGGGKCEGQGLIFVLLRGVEEGRKERQEGPVVAVI